MADETDKLPPALAHVRFPGEDGGRSLAEMAHRDLDAALQLLAFRAQYITEASGAAIAIRRRDHNDMLCRASAGANAPELGTLLSTESGLSGESVRTRLPLLCVDTERDPRVNRDGCRELGIASVAVMPIVGDDGVLGVFELFSGKAGAFGERDLAALKRLSEMAETAVELAEAAQRVSTIAHLPPIQADSSDADVLEVMEVEVTPNSAGDLVTEVSAAETVKAVELPGMEEANETSAASVQAKVVAPEITAPPETKSSPPVGQKSETPPRPKKPLLWSAALQPSVESPKLPQGDQSHVPAVLRDLSKCWSCGFPVSEGRKLCVECEEKQWRGQLRKPTPTTVAKTAVSWTGEEAPRAPAPGVTASSATNFNPPGSTEAPSNQAIAFAAKAGTSLSARVEDPGPANQVERGVNPEFTTHSTPISKPEVDAAPIRPAETESLPAPPNFSTGLNSSESWLSRNKYVLGTILLVAATVAAIFFLRV